MEKARKIVAGAGGIMICALALLGGFYWAGWAHDHPTAVLRSIVGLLIGAICCFIFWFSTSDKRTSDNVGQIKQTTSGSQSPAVVGGVGTLLSIAGDMHLHPPLGISPHPSPVLSPQPVRPKPNLVTLSPTLQTDATYNFGSFRDKPMFVLPVRNVLPSCKAYPVCAGIEFIDGRKRVFHVTKAFWIDEFLNQISIPLNEIRNVTIGYFRDRRFFYFTNPKEEFNEWNVPKEEILPGTILFEHGPINMIVTVFNPDNSDVYLTQKLIMSENEDGGLDIKRIQ
jgi:hypothetical protein